MQRQPLVAVRVLHRSWIALCRLVASSTALHRVGDSVGWDARSGSMREPSTRHAASIVERSRGAMIDGDAWPRGVRRQRRELEEPRAEELRRARCSLAGRWPAAGNAPRPDDCSHQHDSNPRRRFRRATTLTDRLAARAPSEPPAPDRAYEREVRDRVRLLIASLPPRESHRALLLRRSQSDWRCHESRVSQLHARCERLKRWNRLRRRRCTAHASARRRLRRR